jgi:hypothetical protein
MRSVGIVGAGVDLDCWGSLDLARFFENLDLS